MGTEAYRHCPQCGGEYQAWVDRCPDCDVALGAAVPGDLPAGDIAGDHERRTTSVAIDDLSGLQQERLGMLLRGSEVRFEMTADRLWFPDDHADDVDGLLRDVRALEIDDRPRPSRRSGRRESMARADRKVRSPRPEPIEDVPFRYVGAWPRGLARVIDGWITAIVFGLSSLVVEPIPYATGLFLMALLASLESLFGRTPGKAIVGIRVENLAGEPPSLPAAMVRNAWQLVVLMPALGPWLVLVVQGGIAWLIRQEPMHRGPHDLMAQTVVVRTGEPIRHRLISTELASIDRVGGEGLEPGLGTKWDA